jgi:hypothetical protein
VVVVPNMSQDFSTVIVVAVPVDHPGHDRDAARVHDRTAGRRLVLAVRGPDPGDPVLGSQNADAEPEPVRAGVGERRAG